MMDDWDTVGLAFMVGIVVFGFAAIAIISFIERTDRNNPFRNIKGRAKMASDWKKPGYLPEELEMIDKPGIYTIRHDEYHADCCPTPSLSSSRGQGAAASVAGPCGIAAPEAEQQLRQRGVAGSTLGTIAHALLLEDDSSRLITIEADDWRTKAAKEARDEARAAGKIPILTKQAAHLLKMVGTARDFLRSSEVGDMTFQPEQTLAWQEGTTWCRARPDWLSADQRSSSTTRLPTTLTPIRSSGRSPA